jgi:TonB family protein
MGTAAVGRSSIECLGEQTLGHGGVVMNPKIVLFTVFSFLLFVAAVVALLNFKPELSQTAAQSEPTPEQKQSALFTKSYSACERLAKQSVKYSSSFATSFLDLWGSDEAFKDDHTSVKMIFTAQNAFGVKVGGVAVCPVKEGNVDDAIIQMEGEAAVMVCAEEHCAGHDKPAVPKPIAAMSEAPTSSAMSEPLTPSDGTPFLPFRPGAFAPEAPIANEVDGVQGDVPEPEPSDGKIFHVGGAVSVPRQIYAPEPEFSEEARKAKLSGVCTLGLIVGTDGRPSNIRVLKSLGMGLDEKAMEAVQNWKFEPAMKDLHPVRVEIAVEVDFHSYQ